jgi:hypothetical protein
MKVVEPGALAYPVICFSQGIMVVEQTSSDLVTCTKTALKNGYFSDLVVVDSEGRSHRIRKAEKIRGVGPFWGYNVFLNQRIQVQLFEDEEIEQWSVDQTREKVLKSLRSWAGWDASGDLEELRSGISSARSYRDIAAILSSHLTRAS